MIKATIPAENFNCNLGPYAEACQGFSWSDVEKEFTWHETGDINIVHEAVDRWANDEEKAGRKALIFEKGGKIQEFTYSELKEISSQWANLFVEYGFAAGDRMLILLPSCPEVYFAMLACARLGIIFCILFDTLTFDEIDSRLKNSKPRGIITHPDMAERFPPHAIAGLEHVFLTEDYGSGLFPGELVVSGLLRDQRKVCGTRWLSLVSPLYLSYTTSGSTGPPRGIVHSHNDMVGYLATARYVLDLKDDSILWTDAGDPAWITGIVYGAFAPWLFGITSVVQGDRFSASTWYRTLETHRVSIWYTTPRTLTRLMEAGDDLPGRYELSSLRHIATVGETLSPEQLYWTKKTLKISPHDNWWMTETGMICVANFPSMSIRPGSMGKPVPGIEAALLDDEGNPLPEDTIGELALRSGWPGMMTEVWREPPKYEAYFRFKDWFLTGDMATRDADGYYYYSGRNDDLIKVGQRDMGPYEVEQILSRHPAVAEAATISVRASGGNPAFTVFIRLKEGFTPSRRLKLEIKTFVKAGFSPEIPLSDVVFSDELPRTRSGRILERALLARELGLPIGDTGKLRE